jgi:hypothetical protein
MDTPGDTLFVGLPRDSIIRVGIAPLVYMTIPLSGFLKKYAFKIHDTSVYVVFSRTGRGFRMNRMTGIRR